MANAALNGGERKVLQPMYTSSFSLLEGRLGQGALRISGDRVFENEKVPDSAKWFFGFYRCFLTNI